jgi:cytosine/creatinine deaminase
MHAIANARLVTGELVDVVIKNGVVVEVGPNAAVDVRRRVDAHGGLLLPAFIDTHIHLDKCLTRDRLEDHTGTLGSAIGGTHAAKAAYTVEDVRARARAVIESSVLSGTTRLRSHVDVDSIGRLIPLEGVLAAAADCAAIANVQVIAFPQEGLLRDPGTYELMERAMESGAHIVGGMPHWESSEELQREHVRQCFELAQRYDADVDMHVDETDDGSIRTLAMVVDETIRRGWEGRVSVGHVCALAAADDDYADEVITACAESDITVVSNPVTNLILQGRGDRGLIRRGTTRVRELLAHDVNVAFGQDCVNDAFYPFGRGDMLEVALISAHATHLASAVELRQALDAVTTAPAQAWRLGTSYGVAAGADADLQIYAAPVWAEVLRMQHPPTHVFRSGTLVARTEIVQQIVTRGEPLRPGG